MTIVRLGYVAMSMNLKNASPSQTMTFKQFSAIKDRKAAIERLERIAVSNLENCLRLLRHNAAHDIHFFRFSSRLIPLANHEELSDWKYMRPLKEALSNIGDFLDEHPMRVDFHPDHFVLLNTPKVETLNMSIKTLAMHEALLKGMRVDPSHRCVLHVGGGYDDKEKALEQFIHNWGFTPAGIQRMIILENDDTTFTLDDTLYLCEKLGIPLVFDYHHHLANYQNDHWADQWERIAGTWDQSDLPIKMHISSPKSDKDFRAHADFVDSNMFMDFLQNINGSIPEIHCMIEAKRKDSALFKLSEDLRTIHGLKGIDQTSFEI
ncbi:UV DNA damage repair endonuclease UvsE [Cytobacillus sp. NCCP-133]|uniref:UV DNA damage repair endonuclease UvsE n=1 Tax=Cytobacillus sp. NCCP-133 TaxID=766848 RepID=UPI00223111FC|nr:UV DNA damage repair endonuclease UvsE [Cytobacillus sp. NCCP-133]GLB60981.1 UV damage endonuclease UvsE [Cytobacillus sp. NCCP-133]